MTTQKTTSRERKPKPLVLKAPEQSETDISAEIVKAFNARYSHCGVILRNNSGAIRKSSRFIRYGLHNKDYQRGGPDLFAFFNGMTIGVEVKKPKEKRTEEQIAFGDMLEKCGVPVIVARSWKEFLVLLDDAQARWHKRVHEACKL